MIVRLIAAIVFCLGAASSTIVIGQAAPDNGLPPGITIIKHSWTKSSPRTGPFSTTVSNTQEQILASPPGITISNAKWAAFFSVVENSSVPTGTGSETNPNRLPLPTQGAASSVVRTQLYAYTMELTNNGPKPIEAIAWDFIFRDAGSQRELARKSLANLQKIDLKQKKTLRFTTQSSPPKTVSVGALKRDKDSPFTQSADLQCVLFSDHSFWETANSREACQRLSKWIEQKKKARPGIEDVPFN